MEIPPPIRYAARDEASLAFQVFGDGATDLVVVSDPPSHLDLLWTDPTYVEVLLRLAGHQRLLLYDRRGMGLSDPSEWTPTLEEQSLDLATVMDAAGVRRATLFGYGGSAATAAYFAATRPERVSRLVLLNAYTQGWDVGDHDWPAGDDEAVGLLSDAIENWGDGRSLAFIVPSLATRRHQRLFGMLERASASRGSARAAWRAAGRTDLTEVLPTIAAPTLVIRHAGHPLPARASERVAELIPGAELREVGFERPPVAMSDYWMPILDEIESFVTGTREDDSERHRMLATLLFVDIVGSTDRAAELGDHAWRTLLVRYSDMLARVLDDGGGRLVTTTGDGSLSIFDGPVAAVACARVLNEQAAELGLRLRAGVHTGECERVGLNVAGMSVHVGARVEALAAPGEILVTAAARDLCAGAGLEFSPGTTHTLKGVPGRWTLHAVTPDVGARPTSSGPPTPRPADRLLLLAARRMPNALRAIKVRLDQRAA